MAKLNVSKCLGICGDTSSDDDMENVVTKAIDDKEALFKEAHLKSFLFEY